MSSELLNPPQFARVATHKCPNCGGGIQFGSGATQVRKCEYCGAEVHFVRPITVSRDIERTTTEGDRDRYGNFLTILEKSMAAGNFKEAHEYCNKALEI